MGGYFSRLNATSLEDDNTPTLKTGVNAKPTAIDNSKVYTQDAQFIPLIQEDTQSLGYATREGTQESIGSGSSSSDHPPIPCSDGESSQNVHDDRRQNPMPCRELPDPNIESGYSSTGRPSHSEYLPHCILEADKRKLHRNFPLLMEDLVPEEVMDMLIEEGYLKQADYQCVSSESRKHQVAYLIVKMYRMKPCYFAKFLKFLSDGLGTRHIADALNRDSTPEEITRICLTKNEIKDKLEHNRRDIEKQICAEDVMKYFVVYEICDIEQYLHITTRGSVKDGWTTLITFMFSCEELVKCYAVFLKFLEANYMKHLLDQLQQPVRKTEKVELKDASRSDEAVLTTATLLNQEIQVHQRMTEDGVLEVKLTLPAGKASNIEKVKALINDLLLRKCKVLIMSIEHGCIRLRLKFGLAARRRLTENASYLLEVIKDILQYPGLARYIPAEGVQVSVKQKPTVQENHDEELAPKDIVRDNMAFLTEELDANVFLKRFKELCLIEESEAQRIASITGRRKRMESLVDMIIKRDDKLATCFLDLIEERQNEYVLSHLYPERNPGIVCVAENLEDYYGVLLECITQVALVSNLESLNIPREIAKTTCRDTFVMVVVQYAIGQNQRFRTKFVQNLKDMRLLPADMLKKIRNHEVPESVASTEERMYLGTSKEEGDVAIGKICLKATETSGMQTNWFGNIRKGVLYFFRKLFLLGNKMTVDVSPQTQNDNTSSITRGYPEVKASMDLTPRSHDLLQVLPMSKGVSKTTPQRTPKPPSVRTPEVEDPKELTPRRIVIKLSDKHSLQAPDSPEISKPTGHDKLRNIY